MPVNDLGYREWEGDHTPSWRRWWVITRRGIAHAWKSKWVRRLFVLAWVPALYFGFLFLGYEWYVDNKSEMKAGAAIEENVASQALNAAEFLPSFLRKKLIEHPEQVRSDLWAYLLQVFFRAPQFFLMVVMIGLVAPELIANDFRSSAFVLYFSRPITVLEYMLGKAGVVWFYTALVTTGPTLALYLFGIVLSPDLSVALKTIHLPLRILGASVVLFLPTAVLVLLFSALTTRIRFARFGWYAVWILGYIAYASLAGVEQYSGSEGGYWYLLSLYHMLGRVEGWVFGVQVSFADARIALLILSAGTAAAATYLYVTIARGIHS